jgi:FAD/FMN-containing dehydrogenase
LAHIPGTKDPLTSPSRWYVLLEATSGLRFELDRIVEESLAAAIAEGIATDAAIARSEAQRAALWQLRESLSEAQKIEGPSLKHDIAVPVSSVPEFLETAISAVLRLIPGARPVSFGHLGDGNIHFNFSAAKGANQAAFLARWDEIQRTVHDIVAKFGGSFSAEHGVGVMKRADLGRYKSAEEIEIMRGLKRLFDPKNILNPGKLLPG